MTNSNLFKTSYAVLVASRVKNASNSGNSSDSGDVTREKNQHCFGIPSDGA